MTTRRRVFLVAAASLGVVGSAGGLATLASAAPERRFDLGEGEALNALRAEIEQLQARLAGERRAAKVLVRLLHSQQADLAENRRLRGTLQDIADQQDDSWSQLKATEALAATRATQRQYHCSFCDKSQDQVRRLIAGPGAVYICDECVDLCREIIDEESAPPAAAEPRLETRPRLGKEAV